MFCSMTLLIIIFFEINKKYFFENPNYTNDVKKI